MADVEVTYRGQIIRSMSASGTEVLHTKEKYCDDDITIDYTSPGGGGANLQTKSVSYTPSESAISDTILPDPGYDGLDEVDVSVAAIPDSYVGSGIPQRSSADLSVMGRTVTAPSGYYSLMAAAQVAQGTAGTPTASKGAVSNHSVDVTPSVTNTTGYITGSTITGTPVTVSASELVSGSQTITANDTYDVTNLAEVVVNVSGGGGAINGTFTPASNTNSWTIADLAGEPVDHILLRPVSAAMPNAGVRSFMFGYKDYINPYTYYSGTNASGSNYGGQGAGNTTNYAAFNYDSTTGTISTTTGAGSGYLTAGITYEWMVW